MNETVRKRGRPADPEKSDHILEIAGNLFMSKGFHATRMEEIAQAARMSKLTLYRRFANKDALFVAIIKNKCEQHLPDDFFSIFDRKKPREAILIFTKTLLGMVLNDESIAMFRMLGSVARTNPDLTKLFYESGPKRIKAILCDKLGQLNNKGLLKIDDPLVAKEMLTSMIFGSDMRMHRLLNIGKKPKAAEIDQLAEVIADNFMKCWGS